MMPKHPTAIYIGNWLLIHRVHFIDSLREIDVCGLGRVEKREREQETQVVVSGQRKGKEKRGKRHK